MLRLVGTLVSAQNPSLISLLLCSDICDILLVLEAVCSFFFFYCGEIYIGLPYSSSGEESAYNAGDQGSIPGSGRSSGEGNGNPLQCSCLKNLPFHRSPVQVGCMRQVLRAWCTGKTQRDGMGREVGGGSRMGNTCKSLADSCHCMAKTTIIL